jgi:hypothetical protein
VHDAPSADQCPEPHRCLASDHNPEGDIEVATKLTLRKQEYGNDPHGLLRIIPAMAK